MVRWITSGAMRSYRVKHRQQFAHAGHEGDLVALAGGQ
jgi:hypothetical protein